MALPTGVQIVYVFLLAIVAVHIDCPYYAYYACMSDSPLRRLMHILYDWPQPRMYMELMVINNIIILCPMCLIMQMQGTHTHRGLVINVNIYKHVTMHAQE